MARRKNQPEAVQIKYHLAERLRSIRTELYGERGGPELARRIGVPIRTWYNYESGVTVPSEVVLRFIELTSVEPTWLLHGRGPKFRTTPPQSDLPVGASASVQALLRTALQRLESNPRSESAGHAPLPWAAVANGEFDPAHESATAVAEGDSGETPSVSVKAPAQGFEHCEWLAAQSEGRYLRVEGDAMAPIVLDGAFVAYAPTEEDPSKLDGKLVVAWVDERPIVRWFERSGRYALLRAQNPAFEPGIMLVDLDAPAEQHRIRRILWIGTPHR
jgi:phage repressor protein C with HTH and peptisase S24 domain